MPWNICIHQTFIICFSLSFFNFLAHLFCTTFWEIAKIITYIVKLMFLLLKRNNNFGDNKVWKKRKKIPPPLPPQKWPCLRKNYKKLRFSNFRPKKHQLGANQYSKISCSWFLANQMRITKLFSKLRLIKNWPFGRGKREALSTKNRACFLTYQHFGGLP